MSSVAAGVWVVLLNWNGGRETIACLESLLAGDAPPQRLVVCDNASDDGSPEAIAAWAAGRSELGGCLRIRADKVQEPAAPSDTRLVLIENPANPGFAAGNNSGLRLALAAGAGYIWLLNNDTLVAADTLGELLRTLRERPDAGAVGAAVFHADRPELLQVYGGGRLTPLLGTDRPLLRRGEPDYLSGVCLLLPRSSLETVGLLDERFFFYWEDVDLCTRLRRSGFNLAVAGTARVWHIGAAAVGRASLNADLHRIRSLILYFRKHRRFLWPLPVGWQLAGMLVNRLHRRQFDRIPPILRAAGRALLHPGGPRRDRRGNMVYYEP